MKIIVTHASPDLDAIASVWLVKKFLPGWEEAQIQFVSAGEKLQRLASSKLASSSGSEEEKLNARRYTLDAIDKVGEDEVIHVDTGNGALDHHLTGDNTISAASLTLDFLKEEFKKHNIQTHEEKIQALERMVGVIVEIDHFKEIFWVESLALYHDFSLIAILDGLKFEKPNDDLFYVDFISKCFDALLHQFENRIWAEKEIAEKGKQFKTKWGKGIGIETINDSVLKLAQKMDYVIVVRRDPRKGYIRIKAKPAERLAASELAASSGKEKLNARRYTLDANVDLTLVYEQLKKMDPEATWFLHVSKKMLLNGTVKNPKMKPTTLSLDKIIKVLESV